MTTDTPSSPQHKNGPARIYIYPDSLVNQAWFPEPSRDSTGEVAYIRYDLASSPSEAQRRLDSFWTALERSWDIEPRSFFETEAPRSGDWTPEAMAVHHMWKRETKPVSAESLKKAADEVEAIAAEDASRERLQSVAFRERIINALSKHFSGASVSGGPTCTCCGQAECECGPFTKAGSKTIDDPCRICRKCMSHCSHW